VRRLFVGLVVVAVLLAALDVAARVWAGYWVGDQVQQALGLSSRPNASFGGVLFVPQVVSGRIESATLSSNGFEIGGIPFSRARLTFRDVTFRPGQLVLHRPGTVRVRGGAGVFGMTAPDLEEALRGHGVDVSVRFFGQDIRLSGGGLPREVAARPSVEDGALVLSGPVGALFRLPLPSLGDGMEFGGVAVAGDEALLSIRVTRATLRGLVD
jgi:hypothetical protein